MREFTEIDLLTCGTVSEVMEICQKARNTVMMAILTDRLPARKSFNSETWIVHIPSAIELWGGSNSLIAEQWNDEGYDNDNR